MARITFEYGINETEATQPTEALDGFNFDLELGAKRLFPRKPIDLKGTLPNAGSVNGIMQLIKRDDTETTIIYGGAATTPAIYSWTGANTSTAFTSERTLNLASSSCLRDTYWSLGDSLVITDIEKLTPILNWSGTSLTRHKTNLGVGSTTANTGISESSGTYTVLSASHGLVAGDLAIVAGSDNSDLNGEHEVTNVPSAGAWDYVDTAGYGSTSSTHGTTEKGVELFAKYAAVHNGRMWLFNVKSDSDDNPHMCLASAFEDYDSFDTVNRNGVATGNAAFFTLSPDLKAINGVTVFNKQLIISTVDGALHRLSGTDAADYSFVTYYAGSAAIGEESMANIGNDVVFMKAGGNIDRLSDTDRSGDVSADDISRFIPDLTHDLTSAHTVYEQQHQKAYFFLSDKILVLFKDILLAGQGSPWTTYKTTLSNADDTNIFSTKAARTIRRPGESSRSVYFGGTDGKIYDLDGTGTGDNGSDIQISRKTMLLESSRNQVMHGYVQYRRLGEFSLSLLFDWSNEYNTTQSDITLKGPPAVAGNPTYYNGEFYYNEAENFYNEGFSFEEKVSKQNFSPAGRADGFFMTISAETTVQFQLDYIALLED